MPGFRLSVSVEHRGAIFNAATSKTAATRMVTLINDAVALEGAKRVRARLRQVLRNPTGYYESQITVERGQTYRGVWDNNVVYGPWLEGTGSRNKTTRFKGYRTFRMVRQELEKDKATIAEPIVSRFVSEMNQ